MTESRLDVLDPATGRLLRTARLSTVRPTLAVGKDGRTYLLDASQLLSGVPEREREAFGDPLELIWRHCIFGLCGVNDVTRRTFGIVVTSTEAQRRAWLQEAADTVARIFPRPASVLICRAS